MGDYIRARSPKHKQERLQAIMRAADKLFAERPYHQITLGTIADELGWSRSNLYKYVATQEEIFLELHSAKNREWASALAAELASAPMPVDEFARMWAHVTSQHADFLHYQEIIIAIIESNVTLERLTAFKREFAGILPPVANVLSRQCGIDEATAYDLYLRLLFQAPSLYNHFHVAELTQEAMRAAGLPEISGTFEDAYASFVKMCLVEAAKRGKQPAK